MTDSALDKARRDAQEACPCRQSDTMCTADCENTTCECDGGAAECDWPIHAAIARLEAAARLAGRLAQAQEMMVLADSPYCDRERLLKAFDEIYDRLRAEAERDGK